MKKTICLLLTLVLLGVWGAWAEGTGEDLFDLLENRVFWFSSGAGAWYTSITLGKDGSFTGEFHDGEMGETGEGYPDGSVYGCLFHGKLGQPVREDEFTWRLAVEEMEPDEGQLPEWIEDGIRYVTGAPYGLEKARELVLWLPGKPVGELPEAFLPWSHLNLIDPDAESLPYYALWNAAEECGFITDVEEEEPAVGLANPWKRLTAQELEEEFGNVFGVPEGAQDVSYYVLTATDMVEMQFSLAGRQLTARRVEAAWFNDISGIYAVWQGKSSLNLDGCVGTYWVTEMEGEEVQLCLWFDAAPGLMYSLSAEGKNLQDFDLAAVARQVYIPVQGDTDE